MSTPTPTVPESALAEHVGILGRTGSGTAKGPISITKALVRTHQIAHRPIHRQRAEATGGGRAGTVEHAMNDTTKPRDHILAIDPAQGCGGYAVLHDDGSDDGKIIDAGTIKPKGDDSAARCLDLARDVAETVAAWADVLKEVVVETPFITPRGGPKAKRNTLYLPSYGMSVGGALVAAQVAIGKRPIKLSWVPADLWSKRLPRSGDDKEGRVGHAAAIYGRTVASFGPKTYAGNVADAVLLAAWQMRRSRFDAYMGSVA